MNLKDRLEQQNMSIRALADRSGVSYMTLNDLCNEKTRMRRSSVDTVYRIAKALNITVEELIQDEMADRIPFSAFKSNVCHRIHAEGDEAFIINMLESRTIDKLYKRKWYAESFYLLAMTDYLCRLHDLPLCSDYNNLRTIKLKKRIYPASVHAMLAVKRDDDFVRRIEQNAIPEFMRHNIVENEVKLFA